LYAKQYNSVIATPRAIVPSFFKDSFTYLCSILTFYFYFFRGIIYYLFLFFIFIVLSPIASGGGWWWGDMHIADQYQIDRTGTIT
jgi:hypothetical protein